MRLQTKLTEITGRVSMPNPYNGIALLEQEYEELLKEIRICKEAL